MFKLFYRLTDLLKLKPTIIIKNPIKMEQQDTRDTETILRVKKHFFDNHQLLLTRAQRPHRFDCPDPVACENMDCFVWVPDKIVGKPYQIRR